MRNEELIELISSNRFTEAVARLHSEKSRLTNVSVAHPVFDLLKSYTALKAIGYSYYSNRYGHNDLTPEQKEVRERQMLVMLDSMLDAGTDPYMELSKLSSWTNDQEERSQIGIASSGGKNPSYDTQNHTLYSRLAGLGWTAAMDLLLKRGVHQSDKQLSNAIWNVCRLQKQESLHFLLDRHPVLPVPHSYDCAKIMSSVMAWHGVDPVCVDTLYACYKDEDDFDWARSNNEKTDDRTSVEWLNLKPGKWAELHHAMLMRVGAVSKKSPPFAALFRQYVRTGDFKGLLEEALADASFEENKTSSPYLAGIPLASWVLQGQTFEFPRKNYSDWEKPKEEDMSPTRGRSAQIRRAVILHRALQKIAAPTRTPEFPSFIAGATDAMDWAAKGWVPTRAFIHRHPEFLAANLDADTAVHAAKSVDVALAWEKLGASSKANIKNVDPWVLGMQTSDAPAPWAREIAQRLKDGRLSLDASGKNDEPLASIVTRSPPLARAWIKRSRKPLSPAMLAGAIKNDQWPLVCEWLKSGMIDSDPACRIQICHALTTPPASHTSTATNLQGWLSLTDALLERPNLPWEEQVTTWRKVISSGWPRNPGAIDERQLKGMRVLSRWGPRAREHWDEQDFVALSTLVHNIPSKCMDVCPIQITQEEAVDLAWGVLLNKAASRASRYSAVASFINNVPDGVPLSNAGPKAFEQLREVNEEAPYGALFDEPKDFESFLEAEELSAVTRKAAPSRSSGMGSRRL